MNTVNEQEQELTTVNAMIDSDAVNDPVLTPGRSVASVIEPVLPLLAFLEQHGISRNGNIALLYRIRDALATESNEFQNRSAQYIDFVEKVIQSVRGKHEYYQNSEFLRVKSQGKGGVTKKRKLQQYLHTIESVSQLERVTDLKEIADFIGSYLTPRDLSASSLTSKVLRDNVLRYIGGIVEYRSSLYRRPLELKVFNATASIPKLKIHKFSEDDISEAWMLQMTRSLKRLSIQDCKYVVILHYCLRNLTQLEFLDVSRSDMTVVLARNLVKNCKNLSTVLFHTVSNEQLDVDVADEFCKSSSLVNFATKSISFPSNHVVHVRELTLASQFFRFYNRFPQLKVVTYLNLSLSHSLHALACEAYGDIRRALGNIRQNVFDTRRLGQPLFSDLSFECSVVKNFRAIVKKQDLMIHIIILPGAEVDPRLRHALESEPNISFVEKQLNNQ